MSTALDPFLQFDCVLAYDAFFERLHKGLILQTYNGIYECAGERGSTHSGDLVHYHARAIPRFHCGRETTVLSHYIQLNVAI